MSTRLTKLLLIVAILMQGACFCACHSAAAAAGVENPSIIALAPVAHDDATHGQGHSEPGHGCPCELRKAVDQPSRLVVEAAPEVAMLSLEAHRIELAPLQPSRAAAPPLIVPRPPDVGRSLPLLI